jgi:integrase
MFLEKRRNLFYAVLSIPIDCQKVFGKRKFIKSTHTGDKKKAQLIAYQYVASWKLLIEESQGKENVALKLAVKWTSSQTSNENSDLFSVQKSVLKVEKRKKNSFKKHYDEWVNQLDLASKTIDQMSRDVNRLIRRFSTIELISSESVTYWIDDLGKTGSSASIRKRILKGCKNFWRYLKLRKLVPYDSNPFDIQLFFARRKTVGLQKANSPYTTDQIAQLWNTALNQTIRGKNVKDQQLADLILICAYTGNRVEEICSIKLINVTENTFKFVESKTSAGIREVPIHSKLLPIVTRLKNESVDGYLFSGLPSDKYGKRSGIMCKKFGILKTKLGFASRVYTVHSFRATLITMLENAGVSENVAADIVGHKKPRITYGLYSGGASIEVMREAIEKVSYHGI